jgi:hypothetical protein
MHTHFRALALIAATLTPTLAAAHHGAAAYDARITKTFAATITSFTWTSPHGLIAFDTREAHGKTRPWIAETAGLTILVRAGWSKHVLQPGARVSISGHPARNGSPTMILERVVLPDGRTLTNFVPR